MLHVAAAASGQPTSATVPSPATNAPQHVRVQALCHSREETRLKVPELCARDKPKLFSDPTPCTPASVGRSHGAGQPSSGPILTSSSLSANLLRLFFQEADLVRRKIVGMTKCQALSAATLRRGPQNCNPVLRATRHGGMLIWSFIA